MTITCHNKDFRHHLSRPRHDALILNIYLPITLYFKLLPLFPFLSYCLTKLVLNKRFPFDNLRIKYIIHTFATNIRTMQITFEEKYLEDLYTKGTTTSKKHRFQPQIVRGYQKALKYLTTDLKTFFLSNRFILKHCMGRRRDFSL